MFIPKSLHYTKNHLWLMRIGADHFFVGITDFAQKQVGTVHRAHLKLESQTIKKDTAWGKINGTEQSLDLVLPFDCEVINTNTNLDHSSLNTKPYEQWFLRVSKPNIPDYMFLTNHDYKEFCMDS